MLGLLGNIIFFSSTLISGTDSCDFSVSILNTVDNFFSYMLIKSSILKVKSYSSDIITGFSIVSPITL